MTHQAHRDRVPAASLKILEALSKWPNLQSSPHRFGGIEYRVFGTEIGHTHGDHQADVRFSQAIRDRLIQQGKAEKHHILPETGWVSLYIREEKDVERAIALFREAYDWVCARKAKSHSSWTKP